jgi:hypothetical protein
MKFLLLLLVPVMSWLDRQRGMSKDVETIPKAPALLAMGYLCALFTGHVSDPAAVGLALAFAIADSIGFGEPMGHALTGKGGVPAADGTVYEGWQFGPLRTNPWLALAVRGAMLAVAGFAALDLRAAAIIGISWTLAYPAAPAIVRFLLRMPTKTTAQSGRAWAANEWIRGVLAGLLMASGGIWLVWL